MRTRAVSALRSAVRWASIARRAVSSTRRAERSFPARGRISSVVSFGKTLEAAACACASIRSDLPLPARWARLGGRASTIVGAGAFCGNQHRAFGAPGNPVDRPADAGRAGREGLGGDFPAGGGFQDHITVGAGVGVHPDDECV